MDMIQTIIAQMNEQVNPKPMGIDHATVEGLFFTQFNKLTVKSCRTH